MSSLPLELRLRFLETLLSPAKQQQQQQSGQPGVSLTRRTDLIEQQLKLALEPQQQPHTGQSQPASGSHSSTESIRRFVLNYELNAPLLHPPAPQLAHQLDGDELSVHAKLALILEAEHEIKQLERELREVDTLDRRGVVGAGKLADHEPLKRELDKLRTLLAPTGQAYAALERRSNALLSHYNDYISTLSEIFIAWNEIVSSAEEEVARREKELARGVDVS